MTRLYKFALLSTFGVAMLGPSLASAALPPKYQRIAELRAVLENGGVTQALGEALIDRVQYVSRDLYRVHAGRCHVDARIVSLPMPSGMAGPRRFEVRAGRRACR